MYAFSKARFLATDGNINHIVYKICSNLDNLSKEDTYTEQLDKVFLRKTDTGVYYAVFGSKF